MADFSIHEKEALTDFKRQMLFDSYIKKYMPKPCEIVLKNVNTNQILASTTLQLTDYIEVDINDWSLPIGDTVVLILNLKSMIDK